MTYDVSNGWRVVIVILLIWELLWKGLALWRAGREDQPRWFLALLVINSVGLLPIYYLLTHPSHTTGGQVTT